MYTAGFKVFEPNLCLGGDVKLWPDMASTTRSYLIISLTKVQRNQKFETEKIYERLEEKLNMQLCKNQLAISNAV